MSIPITIVETNPKSSILTVTTAMPGSSSISISNLFTSWKFKVEQFKLLVQIIHNNSGFMWCDSIMLKQNEDILNKLDFIKFTRPLKNNKTSRIALTGESQRITKSSSVLVNITSSKKFKKNIISLRKSKKTAIKSIIIDKKANSTTEKINNPTDISYTKTSQNNHDLNLEFTDIKTDQLNLKNLRNDQMNSQICTQSTGNSSNNHIPNININNTHNYSMNNLTGQVDSINMSNSISTSLNNCSYFNLITIPNNVSFSTNNFYQNGLNETNMVDGNVEECVFEEFLSQDLHVQNDINMDHDKFIYF